MFACECACVLAIVAGLSGLHYCAQRVPEAADPGVDGSSVYTF